MDTNNLLFRCSSLGKIMTNPSGKSNADKYAESKEKADKYSAQYNETENKGTKSAMALKIRWQKAQDEVAALLPIRKQVNLSATCIAELRRVWVFEKFGRRKFWENKYTAKGNKVEEDSITLLSLVDGKNYRKNDERKHNSFITGECDIDAGDQIIDIKSSWDIETFYSSADSDLDSGYDWQGRGYMELWDRPQHTVAFCLVNTPDDILLHEIYKEGYNWPGNEAPMWMKLMLVKNAIYDLKNFQRFIEAYDLRPTDEKSQAVVDSFIEIPRAERVHKKTITRDPDMIEELYSRIRICREYISNNF